MRPCLLVTGASSGIGAACARRFLAAGWEVAAVARRAPRLEALQAVHPDQVLPVVADLTHAAAIQAAVARVRNWRPALAAVAHCAGDFLVAPMAHTSATEFERLWRITVWTKFFLTRELLPLLAASPPQPPRAVVHLASLAAHHDFANETAYTSAMHGVIGLARAQDAELRGQGIRVSVVSPGLVRTELTERSFAPADLDRALPPGAIADSIFDLVRTTRDGGYIPEIFHMPGEG